VWSRRAPRLASIAALALALSACGAAKPKPGAGPRGAVLDRRVDPTDVMPADLDLVLRIDIGRMRSQIGPSAAAVFSSRAAAGDDLLRAAIACAEVVWVGVHAGEFDSGDHVVVVEGRDCTPDLPERAWRRVASANRRVRIYDRSGLAPRGGTARVMTLGDRATAFVSPVELDAVQRVIADGPDAKRRSPVAEGVVAADLRAGRLPPSLEKKYPSIGAIVAGLDRVRATAVVVDEGVQIDAQITSPTAKGAEKALRFLTALRDNLDDARYAEVLNKLTIEQVESTVRVRLVLPAKVVLALFSGSEEESVAGDAR
jgi:hypothetical protein